MSKVIIIVSPVSRIVSNCEGPTLSRDPYSKWAAKITFFDFFQAYLRTLGSILNR